MNRNGNKDICVSFLKWAGGKRWLVRECLGMVPEKYGTYIEPFLGSGARFFALRPAQAVLSDLNRELIEAYRAITVDWKGVTRALRKHDRLHSKTHYYRVRLSNPRDPVKRAARLIYLNRTCWNGLYRVNRQGEFNVPIGTKTRVCLPTDNFAQTRFVLRRARLIASDFEDVIEMARRGDFIFVDPPYRTRSNGDGFAKYNEKLFSWSDQIRLRDCLQRAKKRGAFIVATNAYDHGIVDLYEGGFHVKALRRPSVIAGNPRYRQITKELLITSSKGRVT